MPIYEYKCENGHVFEAFQSMSDDSLDKCTECGAPAQRILSAPAIHYKGSGFYTTDYARKGQKKPSGSESGSGSSEKSSSGSDSSSGSKSSDSSSSSSSKSSSD